VTASQHAWGRKEKRKTGSPPTRSYMLNREKAVLQPRNAGERIDKAMNGGGSHVPLQLFRTLKGTPPLKMDNRRKKKAKKEGNEESERVS